MVEIIEDTLHKYLLKKLRRQINQGQAVLHISNKQKPITELVQGNNQYLRINQLEDLKNYQIALDKPAFTYIIADMDMPELDDFKNFLVRVKPLIISSGMLMVIASNLSTFHNKIAMWFDNELENYNRPSRAVTPAFLRNKLLAHGFKIKNRFWQYDSKLLIMAGI